MRDRSVNNVHPNPVNVWAPGIAFNKHKAYNYFNGDGTIKGSFTEPKDHRWHTCDLPLSISELRYGVRVQMTIAIYVR